MVSPFEEIRKGDPELWKELKLIAIEEGKTLKAIIKEALEHYISHKKPPDIMARLEGLE